MQPKMTDEQLIREWNTPGKSLERIAREYGMSASRSLYDRAKRLGLRPRDEINAGAQPSPGAAAPPSPPAGEGTGNNGTFQDPCDPTAADQVRALNAQNKKLITDLKTERMRTDRILEAFGEAIGKQRIRPITPPPARRGKARNEQQMHLYRSDAQVGETVKADDTSGLGDYNFETYKRRVRRLLEKAMLFKEQDTPALGLNRLVIACMGDHLEGEVIYPGQPFHLDMIVVDQLFESLFFEMNEFILPLAQTFHEVEVYCVWGNHGRTGRKGHQHERSNWDYVFYRMTKLMAERAAPNVKVYVSQSPRMLVRHGEFTFSYNHGDAVNSWMGIPYYGLDRNALRVGEMFRTPIDYHFYAHFHTPASMNDNIFINGTLVGGSDLAINKLARNCAPSQMLHYLHPKHGINRMSNLYVDEYRGVQIRDGVMTPVA